MLPQRLPKDSPSKHSQLIATLDSGGLVESVTEVGDIDQRLAESMAPGSPLSEWVHEDDREFFQAALGWSMAEAKAPPTLRLRVWHVAQQWIPMLATLRGTSHGGAEIVLRRDEVGVLERTERQLRDIVDGAQQAITVRVAQRVVYVNQGMARMFGYESRREMFQSAPGAYFKVHPDDQPALVRGDMARAAGNDAPAHYEFRMFRRDGSMIWVDCHASGILWDGEPAGLVYMTDITARKQAEEALKRSEKLFITVFQSSPDVLVLSTLEDGRYVDVNDSFLRLIKRERSEVIGRTGVELGIWTDPDDRARRLAGVLEGRAQRDFLTLIHMPLAGDREFAASAEVIRFEDQNLLLWVARDVMEFRRQEEALCESRDAAERANRSKSEFLACMSHELRTPLNAIIGFAEITKSQMLGPGSGQKYAEYAADIHRSGEHLLNIINDILDLSKLEAGKLELHETEVTLPPLFRDCVLLVSGRASTAGVHVAIASDGTLPRVRADERALKQILINLLTNAVKFTPGGGKVTIDGRLSEAGGT
jgi:PAS domain S-box-containing protein